MHTDKQTITSRSKFRKHMHDSTMTETVTKRKLEQTSLLSFVKDGDKRHKKSGGKCLVWL